MSEGVLEANIAEGSVEVLSPDDSETIISVQGQDDGNNGRMLLPEEAVGDASLTEGGSAVIAPSAAEPDVAYAIHPTEEGSVRVESLILNRTAPTEYSYEFPEADRLEVFEAEGVVWLYAADQFGTDQLVGVVDTPWAVDAAGAAVPTHYEVSENVLTQIVDHTSEEYAYPIVADPKWWDSVTAWVKKTGSTSKAWLKQHVTWTGVKRVASKGEKYLGRLVPGASLVLCAVGGGWAWYRSDKTGWVRVGDAVVGCIS